MAEMTDFTFWMTVIIFAATILAVVTGIIDSSVAAVLGVLAIVDGNHDRVGCVQCG